MQQTEDDRRRKREITIELSLLISGISVAFAIFFGIRDQTRNSRKDTKEEAREDATIITKLEAIQTNMLEVKSEVRSYREEMKDIREHIARDNESLNDYATRISAIPNDVYPAETSPAQTNLSASGLQEKEHPQSTRRL